MINVTKTYLPPLEEYLPYLEKIWDRAYVTNHGPCVQELEQRLKDYLGVKYCLFLNNGTLAIQLALKALGKKGGEVITTPFSYVATTSATMWEGFTPVFADIDPDTLCIDPATIEAAITPNTVAIMPTHVFGNSCDVDAIDLIAKKHGIPVIYDAAHTFGSRLGTESVCSYGSASILSFHATKLFHTIEGGALVTNDDELGHTVEYMRRFGHKGEVEYHGIGINAKNTELHAAVGLCLLDKVPGFIRQRKAISGWYDEKLSDLPTARPKLQEGLDYNYAYYPVLFPDQEQVLKTKQLLNDNDIFPRRYFYPSLNTLPYVDYTPCPKSEAVVQRILCLPLYPELAREDVERICDLIHQSFK